MSNKKRKRGPEPQGLPPDPCDACGKDEAGNVMIFLRASGAKIVRPIRPNHTDITVTLCIPCLTSARNRGEQQRQAAAYPPKG